MAQGLHPVGGRILPLTTSSGSEVKRPGPMGLAQSGQSSGLQSRVPEVRILYPMLVWYVGPLTLRRSDMM